MKKVREKKFVKKVREKYVRQSQFLVRVHRELRSQFWAKFVCLSLLALSIRTIKKIRMCDRHTHIHPRSVRSKCPPVTYAGWSTSRAQITILSKVRLFKPVSSIDWYNKKNPNVWQTHALFLAYTLFAYTLLRIIPSSKQILFMI